MVTPSSSVGGPGAIPPGSNRVPDLEDLLDDVFTRGHSGSNGTLKEILQRAADCVLSYYKKRLGGEEVDGRAHYREFPATAFSRNGKPYEIMVIPFANYGSRAGTEGVVIVYIKKKNGAKFSPAERTVLDNYPMRLVLKDSKGLEITRTELATPVNAQDSRGSAVKLEFVFDINAGTCGVKSGNPTFEEHTRIIDLPVRLAGPPNTAQRPRK